VDCDGDTDAVDALKVLRHVAGLPVSQTEPCPKIGSDVEVTDASTTTMRMWGDADCDGDVDAVDALKKLRHVAGLPVTQLEPCPDIGSPVRILAI
jgi:hypothetical protein